MKIRNLAGFAFDLDGTIWAGETLLPGAPEVIAAIRDAGCTVLFVTNSSWITSTELAEKLTRLGIPAAPEEVVCALELLGFTILGRLGAVPVLPIGSKELAGVLEASGHTVVGLDDYGKARAVAVGFDPGFDFARFRAATRALICGAGLYTCNLDPRLPVAPGVFDPGCGAITEAIAVAGGARPVVVGKPHRPLFEMALKRLGCEPAEAAMVGDSPATDITGGRNAGMYTVLVAPAAEPGRTTEADLLVRGLDELRRLFTKE